MKLDIGYPDTQYELQMLERFGQTNPLTHLGCVATGAEVSLMQQEVKEVYVNDAIKNYIIQFVKKSRQHEAVKLGISPRGSLQLLKAAKGKAYFEGRDYVIPDDLLALILPVWAHRLQLSQEAKLKKCTSESVLQQQIGRAHV